MDERHKEALAALEILESGGFPSMLAGGCVRDRVLGLKPKDFDIATAGEPQAVQKLFSARGFKTIPTGLDHGTVSLIGKYGQYEITTLRKDVSTDGRRAVVAFTKSFEVDATRRDFTINAMYEDRAGKIHDFCGGLDHIREKRLVFVGDPRQRIQEDYLRILRFFRFWARLGFVIDVAQAKSGEDAKTLAAIAEFSSGLKKISQERVTSEVLQILATDKPGRVLESMNVTGVWSVVFPEIDWNSAIPGVMDKIAGLPDVSRDEVSVVRLGALLASKSEEQATKFGKRLRLATSDIYKLTCFSSSLRLLGDSRLLTDDVLCMRFVDFIDDQASSGSFQRIFSTALMVFIEHGDVGKKFEGALPNLIRIIQVEKEHGDLRRKIMPIDGRVLTKELNVAPGPIIKDLLEYLKDRFRAREWSVASDGIQLASQYLHRIRESSK